MILDSLADIADRALWIAGVICGVSLIVRGYTSYIKHRKKNILENRKAEFVCLEDIPEKTEGKKLLSGLINDLKAAIKKYIDMYNLLDDIKEYAPGVRYNQFLFYYWKNNKNKQKNSVELFRERKLGIFHKYKEPILLVDWEQQETYFKYESIDDYKHVLSVLETLTEGLEETGKNQKINS